MAIKSLTDLNLTSSSMTKRLKFQLFWQICTLYVRRNYYSCLLGLKPEKATVKHQRLGFLWLILLPSLDISLFILLSFFLGGERQKLSSVVYFNEDFLFEKLLSYLLKYGVSFSSEIGYYFI